MTTPSTSAQGPAAGWRYSINYGPDGEENYANVYAADGQIVGNLRTHHAIAICNAFAVCDSLTASPPPAASPASPSGDAVHEALREAEAAFETIRVILVNELDEPVRRAFWRAVEARNSLRTLLGFPEPTSLASDATPAPTSGSEKGGDLAAAHGLIGKALHVLGRCHTVLSNMAKENEGAIFNRWPIHHEPLRSDARNLLPLIDEVLGHD